MGLNHINSKVAHDGHKIQLWLWTSGPTNRKPLQSTGKQGCLAWITSIC